MARKQGCVQGGDHVIVTGGSSGIGFAIAQKCISRGAVVSLLARGEERLSAAAEELRAAGGEVHFRAVDVTVTEDVAQAVKDLEAQAGPCQLLVSSAGQARPGRFLELTDDVFRSMMDVDYFGTLWAVRAVAPGMVERGRGTIVTIASTAGLAGVFGYTAYGSAKFAVRGFTEALRMELAPHGVQVTGVFPPDVDTPQLAEENSWKPVETSAITGAIKPLKPQAVADGVMRGLDRGRPLVFLDNTSRILATWGGAMGPLLRRFMDGKVRSAQRTSGTGRS
ncbi:SDR family oxidoreductase [Streptomyces oceani]|uniref:3-dehydrosphinganine reductase n=1 Tax=Streptomyces oceani TaxID=1075402 RepID=A0A1E7KFW1_9ACTN|nr:SDR family oxidoreductase [Streptomyces oceani]OEV02811.1 hypothetical protein AN216_15395 [Streptomyces oceani]